MSDIRLFHLKAGQATELQGDSSDLEKPLQTLIEANLNALLRIRTAPRLVCIAADFTKYDGHAVQQINRNIELIRYRRFGDELLLLEGANAASASGGRAAAGKAAAKVPKPEASATKPATGDRSFAEWLPALPAHLSELLSSLEGYVLSLGDDVQRKELKLYVAFKRLKNFATVVPQKNRLLLYLHLNPDLLAPLPPNGRDVRQQGHWGTGDLELSLTAQADLDMAKPLILMSYEGRGAASESATAFGAGG
jgi:predicted transport protein